MKANPINKVFSEHAALFTNALSLRRDPERQSEAIATILKQIVPFRSAVIEIGCGAGHVCKALSVHGYGVTGLDRSAEMIALARQIHGDTETLRWECRDMMDCEASRSYDAVLLLYSVLQTFLSRDAQIACLQRIRDLLRPSGVFLIECINSPVSDLQYREGEQYITRSGDYLITSWSQTTEFDVKELHFQIQDVDSPGGVTAMFTHRIRKMTRQDLESLLNDAGATVTEWRDAPDFSAPFDETTSSGMLVYGRFKDPA